MKKLIIMFTILFFITGCNNKKLKCFMEQAVSENNVSYTVIVNWQNRKVSNTKFEFVTKFTGEYLEYIDDFKQQLLNDYINYDNKNGINVNVSKSDNAVNLIMNMDLSKMDNELKKELKINDGNSSYKEVKLSLENLGYVCN